ncbi:MAG: hypothetical protein M3N21_04195 [Actinomycetota bacterium]|nr:hypothetical protein [Actinomycetota bacterium]
MRLRLPVRGALVAVLAVTACSQGKPALHPFTIPAASPASPPSSGGLPWPAPRDPLARAVAAGLVPERHETLVNHYHSHLDVFVNGQRVTVPAGLGINIADKGVQHGPLPDGSTAYGGISQCSSPCISLLHTHDDTGIIHTESATPEPNTLGQLFTEWGVALSASCIGGFCRPDALGVYVNGALVSGDPAGVQLRDHTEIAVVIGSPPPTIPSAADFSSA